MPDREMLQSLPKETLIELLEDHPIPISSLI